MHNFKGKFSKKKFEVSPQTPAPPPPIMREHQYVRNVPSNFIALPITCNCVVVTDMGPGDRGGDHIKGTSRDPEALQSHFNDSCYTNVLC